MLTYLIEVHNFLLDIIIEYYRSGNNYYIRLDNHN